MIQKTLMTCLVIGAVFVAGCNPGPADSRVEMGKGVGSDTAADNVLTGIPGRALSALFGEGLQDVRVSYEGYTPQGFKEVQITARNQSYSTLRFEYRAEWVDVNNLVIPTKTSVWMPMSAQPKSDVTFRFIAPRKDAVDFRLQTRKDTKVKGS